MRKARAAPTTLMVAVAVLAVAPVAARAEVVKPGQEQGLGLLPGDIPDVLKTAKADPYAAPPAPACESIPREIATLDTVLGPDADAPPQKTKAANQAGDLMTDAVKSLIPHRGVVRLLTGASRRDKQRADAAMAGWTRRGYLKGMYLNLGCAEREAGAPVEAALQSQPATPAPAPVVSAAAPSTEEAAEDAAAQVDAAPALHAASPYLANATTLPR